MKQPAYVVGGYVRDYYLGRLHGQKRTDIDFVTIGSGIDLAAAVGVELKAKQISTFRQFGTAHINHKGMDLEFVGARKESYSRESRKPVVEDGTMEDDQRRRDFTINAMSWSLDEQNYGELIDPFGGLTDLANKTIRTPVDPGITFNDDPLRMMRAARFAAQLDFDIEENTLAAMKEMAERIGIVSKERVIDELNKIVLSPVPSKGFSILFETDLLTHIFPELVELHGVKEIEGVRHKDNFWHTLQVLDNISRVTENQWLRWAAIMHDIGKPATQRFSEEHGWTFHGHDAVGAVMTRRIFRRLGLPLDSRLKYVQKLVKLHLRPIALVSEEVTDSAIRRLLVDSGDDIDDLMMLCRADITSKNDRKVKQFLANFDRVEQRIREVDEKDKLRNWKPPIGGQEIMEMFSMKPGPGVGKIKNAIEAAILEGEIPNTPEAAKEYAQKIKDEILKETL
ncbi:MAG: CCA tRNA nucleotidyltransferase [Rhodothermaceae bacterium]|nr:CCA tRNA nucleotidyltransferase [Rhodothermaceae bacterium]